MLHNKNTEFVMYVDNFLDDKTLKDLQNTLTKIEYSESKDKHGRVYGRRHTFFGEHHKSDPVIKLIKQYFFPHRNLVAENNVCANFLFFVKGEPLLNNGTGFMKNDQLSSHIGFVENRALFFNGSKILHSDLQSFGDSSPRYTLNIFFREENE